MALVCQLITERRELLHLLLNDYSLYFPHIVIMIHEADILIYKTINI